MVVVLLGLLVDRVIMNHRLGLGTFWFRGLLFELEHVNKSSKIALIPHNVNITLLKPIAEF